MTDPLREQLMKLVEHIRIAPPDLLEFCTASHFRPPVLVRQPMGTRR